MTGSDVPPSFTLAYVPGVTPAKWVRMWNERLPDVELTLVQVPAAQAADLVRNREADAVLLRLPVDRTGLHAIPLYTETTVVVLPKDHAAAAAEEMSTEDFADAVVLHPLDDTLEWERPPGQPAIERPATTADAVELVAAGIGLLVVPQSLARLHHRRDLTYRPMPDAPESRVALSWLEDETTDLMEQMIGIVRGRTVNSTRGRPAEPAKRERPSDGARKAVAGKGAGNAAGKSAGKESAGKGTRRGAGARDSGKRGKPRRRS
ncbi:LysR family transcriptional regulator substrate-binding protein [Lentzea tibetensis]|uniref:LysR family transcriptional regulator substrate-binding protein n=1 Tax=Lentzea tibetensis TaxID=2591470 RepID=A0A563EMT2_9PSEU|nr:LysR family transcriptional regulator substrate-binding protein [Lentzea tibetensis]TWP48496.1 LysR family transcriptional regulator substrate-binding protein [Lentzea tibetensis]